MVLYAQEQFSFFYMRAILNKARLNASQTLTVGGLEYYLPKKQHYQIIRERF